MNGLSACPGPVGRPPKGGADEEPYREGAEGGVRRWAAINTRMQGVSGRRRGFLAGPSPDGDGHIYLTDAYRRLSAWRCFSPLFHGGAGGRVGAPGGSPRPVHPSGSWPAPDGPSLMVSSAIASAPHALACLPFTIRIAQL